MEKIKMAIMFFGLPLMWLLKKTNPGTENKESTWIACGVATISALALVIFLLKIIL